MRKLVTRALLLGASLAVGLALAELGLRALAPRQMNIFDNSRDRMTIHPPNTTIRAHPFGHDLVMNSLGMRDREHARAKPPGTLRILVLGDSFMEAAQVPFERSFPYLLERNLSSVTRRPVEVITAGVGGWGTDDELAWLRRYGRAFDPDVVLVVVTLHNDLSDNLQLEFHDIVDGAAVARPREWFSLYRFCQLKARAWLATHSALYRAAYEARAASRVAKVGSALDDHVVSLVSLQESPQIAKAWSITRALLEGLVSEAHAADEVLVLALIPLELQLRDEDFHAFLTRHRLALAEADLTLPQQRIVRWARGRGVPAIDLLEPFRRWVAERGQPLHLSEGHWNESAHDLAADIVTDQLLSQPPVAAGSTTPTR